MRPSGRERLIVFAKGGRPGAVKTRLVPALGAASAAALHERLVEHTMTTARKAAPGELELCASPIEDAFLGDCAKRHGATLVAQNGADLGERMHSAFERALELDRCSAAVLIGSDCPALTPELVRLAFAALVDHDAVIAPAEDGGYVLIGLSRLDACVFGGIEWSTDRVMARTRERLAMRQLRWHELPTLWDVDRPADYERLVGSGLLAGLGAVPPG
jgi:rSAM/selenodomain-associated transferase 1